MARQVLVIGANRGIGFNLCRQFSEQGWNVTGTVRPQTKNDSTVEKLKAITQDILHLDFTDEASIAEAAQKYGNKQLDVLVNCAGVEPQPVTWQEHTADKLMEKFQIMVVGPFLTTKYFFPALEISKGKVINISSNMASMKDNDFGTNAAYRISKAGLNQLTVTMAMECVKKSIPVTFNAIHPGWTPTAVSHWSGPDDIEEIAASIVKTIETMSEEQTGQFLTRYGEPMNF